MTHSTRKSRGFTLIEAMIVVAVVAVLAGVAYPSYQRQIMKVRRSDAHESLMKAAALQEQFYMDNKRYATKMSELGSVDTSGNPTDSPLSRERYYTVTVSASTATTFKVQAAPVSTGPQAKDTYCDKLTLDEQGKKDKTGTATVADCW